MTPAPVVSGPLAGLRVLDLGNMIAGPFCARLLGDFGADVIKVEQPGRGDPVRGWRSQYRGHSLLWKTMNRNKRAVTLDLHADEDRRSRGGSLMSPTSWWRISARACWSGGASATGRLR